MSEEKERAGLGKVIYSVDKEGKQAAAEEAEQRRSERNDVEEADVESFPASDPPSFAGGEATEDT